MPKENIQKSSSEKNINVAPVAAGAVMDGSQAVGAGARKLYRGDFQRLNRRNMWFRNEKRKELISRYAAKRALLKKIGDLEALDKLPKNACPVRARNLCAITGRSRGVLRYFGICRAQFRTLAHAGELPGVKKYSW